MRRSQFLATMGFGPLVLAAGQRQFRFPDIPRDYLEQPEHIPDFWVSTVDGVTRFLDRQVRRGTVITVGRTAGERPIRAVVYGRPRQGKGTTTFSGSLGLRDVRAYLGPDSGRKVYFGLAGVHGGEFEGIVGMVNLVSVLETGRDLRGRPWPGIEAAARPVDRLVLIPVYNVDGRSRVPLRMERHRASDYTVPEYLNTGGRADGRDIGWPECKRFIPLDFSRVQFPGGYPNDNGVNLQHDDFLGRRQPETEALLDLAARERPDLVLNMHTGAVFPLVHRPSVEPALTPAFDELFRRIMTRLTRENLQAGDDPAEEADPARVARPDPYNLDTALNLHCGALSATIESPSHAFSQAERDGKRRDFSPDDLVTTQLLCHEEALRFLGEAGGRLKWQAKA